MIVAFAFQTREMTPEDQTRSGRPSTRRSDEYADEKKNYLKIVIRPLMRYQKGLFCLTVRTNES